MMQQKQDLFGFQNQGIKYDIFRPNYPAHLLDKAISQSKSHSRYLDIATGTGKILFQLCNSFQSSLGLDLSQTMIDVCKQKIVEMKMDKNIQLKCENFMEAQFQEKYDLVTIGQALHWFPIKDFLIKAKSLLNPTGVLAVFGNILDHIEGKTPEQTAFLSEQWNQFYVKRVKPNHDCDLQDLHILYKDTTKYPFDSLFSQVKRQSITKTIQMDRDVLISYVKTFSGYNTYHERHSNEEDPILYLEKIAPGTKVNCIFYYFSVICKP